MKPETIIDSLNSCIKNQHENCCNLGSWHEQWNCMADLMNKARLLIVHLNEENKKLKADNNLLYIALTRGNK